MKNVNELNYNEIKNELNKLKEEIKLLRKEINELKNNNNILNNNNEKQNIFINSNLSNELIQTNNFSNPENFRFMKYLTKDTYTGLPL